MEWRGEIRRGRWGKYTFKDPITNVYRKCYISISHFFSLSFHKKIKKFGFNLFYRIESRTFQIFFPSTCDEKLYGQFFPLSLHTFTSEIFEWGKNTSYFRSNFIHVRLMMISLQKKYHTVSFTDLDRCLLSQLFWVDFDHCRSELHFLRHL